jgi:predicted nucleic acid-binding protein
MNTSQYFIDTNIFIYSVGRDHPLRSNCASAIRRIRDQEIRAILNTEIIQEILYRYQSIKELQLGIRLAREAMSLSSKILSVTERDLALALELLESHPQIDTRDAFHAATMVNNDIKEIIATDSHFDLIPGINRIDPAHWR